ncbi:MAG TPA: ATP-binding cassette domain-containing protein, partial [Polyangiales bacterium]
MNEPLITASHLTMGWGDTVLQRDANFRVDRGEVFVILGGSGCGKSTMLRHLTGLEVPLDGTILVKGVDPKVPTLGPPPFGVMFQSGALLGSLTV